MERRVKIVTTLGPAVSTPEKLRELLQCGADMVRVNAAHGSEEDRLNIIENVRAVADELGRFVPILFDLRGLKIRTGPLPEGKKFVRITEGQQVQVGELLQRRPGPHRHGPVERLAGQLAGHPQRAGEHLVVVAVGIQAHRRTFHTGRGPRTAQHRLRRGRGPAPTVGGMPVDGGEGAPGGFRRLRDAGQGDQRGEGVLGASVHPDEVTDPWATAAPRTAIRRHRRPRPGSTAV